jgi:uncharacterized protein (TIGR03435 family)
MGGFPLSQLAQLLSGLLRRTVVDRTGLPGNFDLELTYAADELTSRDGPEAPSRLPLDSNQPNIFTAIEEQLGLKLESTSGPVEVHVVDNVRRLTEV